MAGLFFSCYNNIMNTINLEHNYLFPTTIGKLSNIELAQKVLPYAIQVLSDSKNLSNTWGYKNSYNRTPPESPILSSLVDFIRDIGDGFLQSLGIFEKCGNIKVFFSEMIKGDYHDLHTHPNAMLSGVFYLSVPPNSSPLVIQDAKNHYDHIQYRRDSNNPLSSFSTQILPIEGLFLIWPAWVPHKVLMNKSEEGRITCVFNIGVASN